MTVGYQTLSLAHTRGRFPVGGGNRLQGGLVDGGLGGT